MVASMIACLLAHHYRRRSAPPPARGAVRNKAPIHPQAISRLLAAMAPYVSLAFEMKTKKAQAEWDRFAMILNRQSDPNWRSRPSILDQMRGWKLAPSKARLKPSARCADASRP
jgi:hypothetical protein